jgi:DNA-binding transcriptional LysR family regulator
VARTGSLAGAAAALRASEATVARHLGSLEQALGLRLFDRLANRLRLTEQGERLVEAAGAMEAAASDVQRLARVAAAAPAAPVRITSTSSVAMFLVRHLPVLMGAAGAAPLDLVVTRETLDLSHREAEIALRMRRPPERGQLVVRRLGRIAFTLFGSASVLETGAEVDPIGLRDDPSSRQARWLRSFAPDARMPLRLGDMRLRLDAVLAGQGLGLLPCFVGDCEPRLVRVVPPPAELEEDVFLLVHRDLVELPAVRHLMDALVQLFRREGPALRGQESEGPSSIRPHAP